jgi:uncharacterized protein YbjT (DUF2867 family)
MVNPSQAPSVLILGATGGFGQVVVRELLSRCSEFGRIDIFNDVSRLLMSENEGRLHP